MRRDHILILCAALLATLPLLLQGDSCGHDFVFHTQSWLDAAEQLRHGTLLPHWTFSSAFNAGEPRFVFYPPLSWMVGALLTLVFPVKLAPVLYTFLTLSLAGLAMLRLAGHFSQPNAAVFAAILYVTNPYMLFTLYERSAYAELLAAAWLPLLLLAALRARPTIPGLALPIALLWLSNAPAAVMGCYALALIFAFRMILASKSGASRSHRQRQKTLPEGYEHQPVHSSLANRGASAPDEMASAAQGLFSVDLALTAIAGAALGLALSAFYLVPAAYERRFVQIAMAIIPGMRFQDNFLFGHIGDAPHDAVLHTASLIAVVLLLTTLAALAAIALRSSIAKQNSRDSVISTEGAPLRRSRETLSSPPQISAISNEAPPHQDSVISTEGALLRRSGETCSSPPQPLTLLILTLTIAFLLTPLSTPLWHYLPDLAFLQFPWRFLALLSAVAALTLALALPPLKKLAAPVALTMAAALVFLSIHNLRQGCEVDDRLSYRAAAFHSHAGFDPTDEYTPANADNDALRSNDPSFWLSTDPEAMAPGSHRNPAASPAPAEPPAEAQPNPAAREPLTHSPATFTVDAPDAEYLVLNLRDYPNWIVTLDDPNSLNTTIPPHIGRDDGLIALPLSHPGKYTLHIAWHRALDQQLGLAVSVLAALVYALLMLRARSRRIEL